LFVQAEENLMIRESAVMDAASKVFDRKSMIGKVRTTSCWSADGTQNWIAPAKPNLDELDQYSDFLLNLLDQGILDREAWFKLNSMERQSLATASNEILAQGLVERQLLTRYQMERVLANNFYGLMIGNYRVLQRIGAGGMGTVFKAEQLQLRRPVAVKLLSFRFAKDERLLARFWAESRAIALLQHPNIVSAIDAGEYGGVTREDSPIPFLVMEYLDGRNLEEMVRMDGPLDVVQVCKFAVDAAEALAEAHRFKLIHRDIKPSNLFVTQRNQLKLLDFGLVRLNDDSTGMTDPGSILGTIGYMSPEQANDATSVDERSDLFSLGATLYYALTGRPPFGDAGTDPIAVLQAHRRGAIPPSFREYRLDVPTALESMIFRLLAIDPKERFPNAVSVVKAFLPFTVLSGSQAGLHALADSGQMPKVKSTRNILIVDDSKSIRFICNQTLSRSGYQCQEAEDGATAIDLLRKNAFDLVLLDFHLPDYEATELTKQIRQEFSPTLKIVVMSGVRQVSDLAPLRLAGVDDCFVKPFTSKQLLSILRANLDKKDEEERGDKQSKAMAIENAMLKTRLHQLELTSKSTQTFFVETIAELVNERCCMNSSRSRRLQRCISILSNEAAHLPDFHDDLTSERIEQLEMWIPILDIGYLLLPEYAIMDNSGSSEEAEHVEAHTKLAGDVLARVMERVGATLEGIQLAIILARYHHERFDGTGFPDALRDDEIPLPARLASIVDGYDQLRSPIVDETGLNHHQAMDRILNEQSGRYDPRLLIAFRRGADRIAEVYRSEE
jgi:putative two-component system response regulator